jgi:AraC-like DNA-binding protein
VTDPPTTYKELQPHPSLAKHVSCVWFQSVAEQPVVHRVVPDACADVVSIAGASPVVVGPATGAVLVTLPARSLVVGIRFRPGMAGAALGVSASELLDLEVSVEDVWGSAATRSLWDGLGDAEPIRGKLAVFERFVAARLGQCRPADELVHSAVTWLAPHPAAHVSQLVADLGVSSRALLRRFHEAVGYGPKTLQRVLRFQRLLLSTNPPSTRSLARLAAEAGYLDQAHMTREVVALAGIPPSALRASRFSADAMSDFFNTLGDAEP